jgi:CheY-like chemotaxis protein
MAKILLVDDKEDVCRVIEEALRSDGHRLIIQHTVEDAVALIRRANKEGEPFEVCLIDLRFDNYPGTEAQQAEAGMEVLDEALQVILLEPIILTAFGSIENAQKALAKGAFRHVSKPGESAAALKRDSTFTENLIEMVRVAVINRNIFSSLRDALLKIERSQQEVKQALVDLRSPFVDQRVLVIGSRFLSVASDYSTLARELYEKILAARGRDPKAHQ